MTTPHEAKFELERQLLALAEGRRFFAEVHSVVCEDGVASFAFDVQLEGREPEVLLYNIDLPIQQVSLSEMNMFASWLVEPTAVEYVH